MDTGLVLRIPEAEDLVSGWRQKYDKSAAQGVPAHVTIPFPFKPFELIDADCLAKLAKIFSAVASFDLKFSQVGRFPDTVWLAPEPATSVVRLTKALVQVFPENPPYGGVFGEPIPHLTVAQGSEAVLDAVTSDLESKLKVPIRSRIAECSLFALQAEGWRERHRFSLG